MSSLIPFYNDPLDLTNVLNDTITVYCNAIILTKHNRFHRYQYLRFFIDQVDLSNYKDLYTTLLLTETLVCLVIRPVMTNDRPNEIITRCQESFQSYLTPLSDLSKQAWEKYLDNMCILKRQILDKNEGKRQISPELQKELEKYFYVILTSMISYYHTKGKISEKVTINTLGNDDEFPTTLSNLLVKCICKEIEPSFFWREIVPNCEQVLSMTDFPRIVESALQTCYRIILTQDNPPQFFTDATIIKMNDEVNMKSTQSYRDSSQDMMNSTQEINNEEDVHSKERRHNVLSTICSTQGKKYNDFVQIEIKEQVTKEGKENGLKTIKNCVRKHLNNVGTFEIQGNKKMGKKNHIKEKDIVFQMKDASTGKEKLPIKTKTYGHHTSEILETKNVEKIHKQEKNNVLQNRGATTRKERMNTEKIPTQEDNITPQIKKVTMIRDKILISTQIHSENGIGETQDKLTTQIPNASIENVKKRSTKEVFKERKSRSKTMKSLKFSDTDSDGEELLTKTKFRIKFTNLESFAIQSGIEKYGWGKWSVIKANYEVLKNRTTVQIKDRARTMKSNRNS